MLARKMGRIFALAGLHRVRLFLTAFRRTPFGLVDLALDLHALLHGLFGLRFEARLFLGL